MSVRNKDYTWTSEAREFTDKKILPLLKENFNEAIELGFSFEDWYYIISRTADDIILDKCLEEDINRGKRAEMGIYDDAMIEELQAEIKE